MARELVPWWISTPGFLRLPDGGPALGSGDLPDPQSRYQPNPIHTRPEIVGYWYEYGSCGHAAPFHPKPV